MQIRSHGDDSNKLKFEKGSEVTEKEGGKKGGVWVSDSWVIISWDSLFLRHRCLILCSPSCSAVPLISAHAVDGEASGKDKAGNQAVAPKAQNKEQPQVSRATNKDQGQSPPISYIKGSFLVAFFFSLPTHCCILLENVTGLWSKVHGRRRDIMFIVHLV